MTHNEFEKLVQVNVTSEEYSHIEYVYLQSDLNKYEFACMWKQMNKKRVEIAKQERKQAAAKDKQNTKLWSIYTKYFFNDNINRWASADTFLTKREIATLENSNISTEHSIFNILCEIRNKITNK